VRVPSSPIHRKPNCQTAGQGSALEQMQIETLSCLPSQEQVPSATAQRRFLPSICAIRAFTIFLISALGSGLSVGNWMVPLDRVKPFNSF
jgi:hypothetical protein